MLVSNENAYTEGLFKRVSLYLRIYAKMKV